MGDGGSYMQTGVLPVKSLNNTPSHANVQKHFEIHAIAKADVTANNKQDIAILNHYQSAGSTNAFVLLTQMANKKCTA